MSLLIRATLWALMLLQLLLAAIPLTDNNVFSLASPIPQMEREFRSLPLSGPPSIIARASSSSTTSRRTNSRTRARTPSRVQHTENAATLSEHRAVARDPRRASSFRADSSYRPALSNAAFHGDSSYYPTFDDAEAPRAFSRTFSSSLTPRTSHQNGRAEQPFPLLQGIHLRPYPERLNLAEMNLFLAWKAFAVRRDELLDIVTTDTVAKQHLTNKRRVVHLAKEALVAVIASGRQSGESWPSLKHRSPTIRNLFERLAQIRTTEAYFQSAQQVYKAATDQLTSKKKEKVKNLVARLKGEADEKHQNLAYLIQSAAAELENFRTNTFNPDVQPGLDNLHLYQTDDPSLLESIRDEWTSTMEYLNQHFSYYTQTYGHDMADTQKSTGQQQRRGLSRLLSMVPFSFSAETPRFRMRGLAP